MSKMCDIVELSVHIPVNVDNKIKDCAKNMGVSKNAVLLIALKNYLAKEVHG
jgi:hypothetical protein